MIHLGMHTDNWRPLSGSFQMAVDSAVKYGLTHIEFGVIHGQYFVNGLGYDPAVSLQSNPRKLRRYLEKKNIQVSQIDGAFPMMGPEGSTFGVPYVQQAIRFAAETGRRDGRVWRVFVVSLVLGLLQMIETARLRSEGNGFLVQNPPLLLSAGAPPELWERVRELIAGQPAWLKYSP